MATKYDRHEYAGLWCQPLPRKRTNICETSTQGVFVYGRLAWVSVSVLKGALLQRDKELVKQAHGIETWEEWLEM